MNLAVSANQLADWVLECGPRSGTERFGNDRLKGAGFRTWLASDRCSDFRAIWDLVDSHKHMLITRGWVVSREVDGAFDHTVFDQGAFDIPHLSVVLQDGTERRFP